MARFRFRLATLEKLREIHRDELRLKHAEAVQAHQILEQQLDEVGDELAELEASRRTAVSGGVTDINSLLTAQRYQAVLLAQQKTMREQSRLLANESEQRRQAVVEADRQVKVLEKLYDRQLTEFQEKQQLAETKLLDEVASRCRQEDFSLVRGLRDGDHGGFNFNRYWKRSLFCAAATRAFGSSKGILELENLFLAGLLQDIGMLALQALASKDYGAISETAGDDHFRLIELEKKLIGADHAQIGSWLAEQWRLPEGYIEAIKASHNPAPKDLTAGFDQGIECVFLSNCLAELWLNTADSAIDRAWQNLAGRIDEETLESVTVVVEDWFSDLSDLFQIPVEDSERASEILLEAREQLAEISIENLQRARQLDQERDRLAARNLELKKRSYQDPLTGLYNRAFFDDTLVESFRKSAAQGKSLSAVFCDIDHFKKFNDEYGHKCGDEVLSAVGKVIQEEIRLSDFAVRFGGDEFVLFLPEADHELANRIATRITDAVAKARIQNESGSSIFITISAGCATHDSATPYESLSALCEAADLKLCQMKRDRVRS